MKPPRSRTIAGTAVARMVASIAISAIEIITDPRIGPRSLRRPTEARVGAVAVTPTRNRVGSAGIPRRYGVRISRSGGKSISTSSSNAAYSNHASSVSSMRSR